MQPELLHEFVADLTKWTRERATALWLLKASTGSPFYWPKEVGDPTKDVNGHRARMYDQVLSRTRNAKKAKEEAENVSAVMLTVGMKDLADFHADTLETAQVTFVGKDITYLASKAEMKDYRLQADDLPAARGFMVWETPIGMAEPRGMVNAYYDGGELESVDVIGDMMESYRTSDNPVTAASWRLLPEENSVLVVFYTDGQKGREFYKAQREEQKKNLQPGERIDESIFDLYDSDPMPLEREQVIPLDVTLGWFHEKDKEERLRSTVQSDPSYLDLAVRGKVEKQFTEANEKILPMLSQMVKTFVATLALRKMKIASREAIEAPSKSKKRMRRAGVGEERIQSKVTLVKLGQPIRRRPKGDGSVGGKWKVRTLIGPVIRHRQYVPAYDEYRDGTWVIGPYWAGPEGAPWSKNVKVYLLE